MFYEKTLDNSKSIRIFEVLLAMKLIQKADYYENFRLQCNSERNTR